MSKENRLDTLISLMDRLNPGESHDGQTAMRGTTLEKLAEFDGGGYQRVKKWLEEKIEETEGPTISDLVNEDVKVAFRNATEILRREEKDEIELFFEKCIDLYRSRKEKYGDSWKVLSASSTANLIEMKANRAAKMGDKNAKSLDEAIDMANYAAMLYVKLNDDA